MKLNELTDLFADDRAVSPVVGVALLIAITVILAAVIGGVVLGLGTGGAEVPQAQLNAQLDNSTNTAEINHNGGEALSEDEIVIKVEGDDDVRLSGDFTTGNTLNLTDSSEAGIDSSIDHIDEDATVTVIWEDPDSDSENILAEFEE